MSSSAISDFIVSLNREYLTLHHEKENLFWSTKMGISKEYDEFNKAEGALNAFKSNVESLNACRDHLASGDADEKQTETLKGWIAFFEANVIEDAEARKLSDKIVEMESALARSRGNMTLGYTDPESGEFVNATSVGLSLKLATAPDAALREACFKGMESIESHVLDEGFLEIVKERNRLSRSLGYEDYYDYKVRTTEGFGKEELFGYLDDLKARTEDAQTRYVDSVREEKGEDALLPWNFRYMTQGSVIQEMDPYLQFTDALLRWGQSFAALNITYENATLQLDLVDRKGKYENGFCHAPVPPFEDAEGRVRAEVNFTSNAVPGQTGSGKRAAQTLFHEGGHAAHFANMLMGAPCFSQEFAPTSAAFAETQSMFLDSLLDDADWLVRYAKNADGEPMPWEVIEKATKLAQPAQAYFLRSLLMICYAEKALYEMPEEKLTPENVMACFIDIEKELGGMGRCSRPTLAVPHLLSGEASCIYHGYVLALAGVAQTRHYFLETYGHLTDNPRIGPEMREKYWRPGNSIRFVDFIERMTGKPFSMDALVGDASMSIEEALAEQKNKVEKQANLTLFTDSVKLEATVRMVHGEKVIASTENGSFEAMAETYRQWLEELE